MTIATIILLSLVVAVSAFIQGAVGVGFALIIAPVFSLVNPDLVPVVLLFIMLPLNFLVMYREWGRWTNAAPPGLPPVGRWAAYSGC